jgi:hypothetical protein
MSPSTAQPRSRSRLPAPKKGKQKSVAKRLLAWWPVLLGIAVTPLAMQTADVLVLRGPDGLRVLYPYVVIVKHHLPWVSHDKCEDFAQVIMYLQFVIYGLFLKLSMGTYPFFTAALQTLALHGIGVGFLICLAYLQ